MLDAETKQYEATTVGAMVQGEPVMIATLRETFDRVANAGDWKASWAAMVPCQIVPLVMEAVAFYHGARPRVEGGPEPLTGRVLMVGDGYAC